jgi:hypothetical protein
VPRSAIAQDVEEINSGAASLHRGRFTTSSGRVYIAHGSQAQPSLIPVEGPGIVQLDRGGLNALRIMNRLGTGDTAQAQFARERISPDSVAAARQVYDAVH